jgi:Ca2+/Na+ antiporter
MFGATTAYGNSPHMNSIRHELLTSTELIFRSRLTWLLVFGPIALIGKAGVFGESTCFILAGLTLIPLAERLSFVTEEVANHTSQTVGALLNATFGNAPELLISAAALHEGFYRVVQLTLLGSILTNLLFVFGMSCLVGGLRYQVQELRIVSGNASIGMLMLAVAALGLPAALMLSDEMRSSGTDERIYVDKNGDGVSDINDGPTFNMIWLSRFNATIMIAGYLLYLLFQLKTHKDEFDDLEEEEDEDEEEDRHEINEEGHNHKRRNHMIKTKKKTRKNKFCRRLLKACRGGGWELDDDKRVLYQSLAAATSKREMEMSPRGGQENNILSTNRLIPTNVAMQLNRIEEQGVDIPQCREISDVEESRSKEDIILNGDAADVTVHTSNASGRRRSGQLIKRGEIVDSGFDSLQLTPVRRSNKSHCSDGEEEEDGPFIMSINMATISENGEESKSLHC